MLGAETEGDSWSQPGGSGVAARFSPRSDSQALRADAGTLTRRLCRPANIAE